MVLGVEIRTRPQYLSTGFLNTYDGFGKSCCGECCTAPFLYQSTNPVGYLNPDFVKRIGLEASLQTRSLQRLKERTTTVA